MSVTILASAGAAQLQMARRPLHEPRVYDEGGLGRNDPLLKRASKLAHVAKAVGDMDLQAIAATYQKEAGSTGLEAAVAASAAMNAVLKTSLMGETGVQAAEREVQNLARKKARDLRTEEYRQAQAEEEGVLGEIRREQAREALEARASKAAEVKATLMTKDIAERKAEREARLSAAASRRAFSEAKAWLHKGQRHRSTAAQLDNSEDNEDDYVPPEYRIKIEDPVLQRAKNLAAGAQKVAMELDKQNEMLRNKALALSSASTTRCPSVSTLATPAHSQAPYPTTASTQHGSRFNSAHAAAAAAEEAALVAKAKELLADYKPAEAGRRPPLSPSSTTSAAQASSVLFEGPMRRSRPLRY